MSDAMAEPTVAGIQGSSQEQDRTGTIDTLDQMYTDIQGEIEVAIGKDKSGWKGLGFDTAIRLHDVLLSLRHWGDDVRNEVRALNAVEGYEGDIGLATTIRSFLEDIVRDVGELRHYYETEDRIKSTEIEDCLMEELENSVECLRAQVEPLRTFFDAKIGSGFVTTVRKAAISWEIQKHEHQHELAAETTKGSSLGTEQNATSRLAIQSRPNPSALQLQVPPSHGVEEVGVRTHSVANTEPVPAGLRLKFVPEEISEENVPHPFVPSISHLHANRPPDITDGQCSTEIMGKEPNTANQIMRGESLPTEPEFTAMRDILPYVRGDETEQHSELDSKRFDPREFIRSDKGLGKERSSEPPDTTSKLLDWCFYRFFDYPKYDYLTQVLDRGNPPGSDDSISEVMFSRGEPTMSEAAKSTGEVDSVFERFPMEVGIFATTEDNPGRAALLKTPRDIIFSRFKRTLNMDDLKVAISNIELAVSATPEDDPDRVVMLNNLGNQLFCRFELTGNIDDLEAAISNLKQAISIIPKYHPARAAMLNDFGGILLRQYNRTGDINDLEAAISNVELALSITPKDDPDQAAMLNNFGNMLFCRYKKTGNINDLRTAISNAELAVSATPQNHPNREGRLTSLRNMLGSS